MVSTLCQGIWKPCCGLRKGQPSSSVGLLYFSENPNKRWQLIPPVIVIKRYNASYPITQVQQILDLKRPIYIYRQILKKVGVNPPIWLETVNKLSELNSKQLEFIQRYYKPRAIYETFLLKPRAIYYKPIWLKSTLQNTSRAQTLQITFTTATGSQLKFT